MSWTVLVDGYNVLQNWPQFTRELETRFNLARNRLIRMIAGFADYQGHRVIVVFDAPGQGSPRVKRKRQEGIQVVYTRRGQTADDYIIEWVKQYRGDEHIEVITSDGELSQIVQQFGASVRTTFEFSDTYARTGGIRSARPQDAILDSDPRLRDCLHPKVRRQLEQLKRRLGK